MTNKKLDLIYNILTKKNIDNFKLILDYYLNLLNKMEFRFIESYLEDRDIYKVT